MSEKDKIISEVYYDQAGFGSIATTYKDAKKKDASITTQDVKEWFQENVERKNNCLDTIRLLLLISTLNINWICFLYQKMI